MGMGFAEDWRGRYWTTSSRAFGSTVTGAVRSRLCADPECIWPVVIERRGVLAGDGAGWWWVHGDLEVGPFAEWQEASDAAFDAGVVPFDRRLDG